MDMGKENLYQPFELIYKECNECPLGDHQNNFFELVYILEGTGKQTINKNAFDFRVGNMFLITPQDHHSFKIETTTKFLLIRFSNIYLNQKFDKTSNEGWLQRMEFILQNASHQPGCILKNQGDKILMRAMIDSVVREHVNQELYHKEMIQQIVYTIITIVARNIALNMPEKVKGNSEESVVDIIQYIQQHIYNPANLRAEKLASQFNISESYLGRYFKKHTGENLQQYITNYKLKLVETRLQHSDLRINEIASELNFTDESHMNRIFKKHRGVNPSDFRKKFLEKNLKHQKA
jgi:AraC family transcriptional regulator, L-rhamnose operon regulatory protein RhaS